jgi:hypothetical protein
VYPEFINEEWIDPGLIVDVRAASDQDGLAAITSLPGVR